MKTIKTIVTNLTNPTTVDDVKNVATRKDCMEDDNYEEMVDDPLDISDGAHVEKDTGIDKQAYSFTFDILKSLTAYQQL